MFFMGKNVDKLFISKTISKIFTIISLIYLLLLLNFITFVYLINYKYIDENKLEKSCLKTNTIILNDKIFKCDSFE
jgi:hypothetical protein